MIGTGVRRKSARRAQRIREPLYRLCMPVDSHEFLISPGLELDGLHPVNTIILNYLRPALQQRAFTPSFQLEIFRRIR